MKPTQPASIVPVDNILNLTLADFTGSQWPMVATVYIPPGNGPPGKYGASAKHGFGLHVGYNKIWMHAESVPVPGQADTLAWSAQIGDKFNPHAPHVKQVRRMDHFAVGVARAWNRAFSLVAK